MENKSNLICKMINNLPGEMVELINNIGFLADNLGCRVYIVGGFVRDLLLGKSSLDIDISVEGSGIAFAEEFHKKFGNKIKVHEKFQTASLKSEKIKIDIVTARSEHYEQFGAMPIVKPADINSDLFRRDFSINSIAISINKDCYGQLIDPVGGEKDLQDGIIKILYNMSFMDDPTRIFRAVKFEQRYNFNIEEKTLNLINDAVKSNAFNFISKDRIANELSLIFKEESKIQILKRLKELGILKNLIENSRIEDRLITKCNETLINHNNQSCHIELV